jgi:hypothetical protein
MEIHLAVCRSLHARGQRYWAYLIGPLQGLLMDWKTPSWKFSGHGHIILSAILSFWSEEKEIWLKVKEVVVYTSISWKILEIRDVSEE